MKMQKNCLIKNHSCDQRALAFGESLRIQENVTNGDMRADSPFTVTYDPGNVSIWEKISEISENKCRGGVWGAFSSLS